MASRFVLPYADVGNGISNPSGAKLFFFEVGTSTDKDTFANSSGSITNSNPVIADGDGIFPDIFISGSYKIVLKDRDDVQKSERDPVTEFAESIGGIIYFDTVADMIASNLTIGQRVRTLGYLALGDGGGNTYDIVANGTGAADGGSFIDLTFPLGSPSQARGIFFNDIVNIKQFGAVGDGSTDDTTKFSNAITFNNNMYVPNSIYIIDGSLTISKTFKLTGETIEGAILRRTTNATLAPIIVATGDGVDINDITFEYTGAAPPVNNLICGLNFRGSKNSSANRVRISGQFYLGLWVDDCKTTNITSCVSFGVTNRNFYASATVGNGLMDVSFTDCHANGWQVGTTTPFSAYGFNTNGFGTGTGDGISFEGCTARHVTAHGFGLSERIFTQSISNCLADDATFGFIIQQANAFASQRCNITASHAIDCSSDGFLINGAFYVNIAGCTSFNNVGEGFNFVDVQNATLSGCIATNNTGNGFHLHVGTGTTAFIAVSGCQSDNNNIGFNSTAATVNCNFVGNISTANTTDYNLLGVGIGNTGNI